MRSFAAWLLFAGGLVVSSVRADTNRFWRVPEDDTIRFVCDSDWRARDAIEVEVQSLTPHNPKHPVRLFFFLENKQDLYFQSQKGLLLDGTRQTLRIELHENRATLWCANARRPLAPDALRWVRAWGLKVHASGPAEGLVRIGTLRTVPRIPEPLRITDISWPEYADIGHRQTIRFQIAGFIANPFCPRDIEAVLAVRTPDGKRSIPAHYRQEYRSIIRPGRYQAEPVAVGTPFWQANWCPQSAGLHQLTLTVRVGDTTLSRSLGAVAVAPAGSPALPRATDLSNVDPASFSGRIPKQLYQQNGPHWLPPDIRSGNSNLFWQVRLDWTPDWGRFTGMGEFDLLAAWLFERVLDRHVQNGLPPRPLLAFGEEELGGHGIYNWPGHPFNRENGGHLSRPGQLYADSLAEHVAKSRARYLWARYGDHPAVAGLLWQSVNEAPQVVAWIRRISADLCAQLPDLRLFSDNPALPERTWHRPLDFTALWTDDPRLAPDTKLSRTEPEGEVLVETGSARTAALTARSVFHWAGAAMLSFTILPHAAAPEDLKVMAFFRTGPRQIYESGLRALDREEWNRISFRLDAPDDWSCALDSERHPHPYDWMNVREVGLRFFRVEPGSIAATVGSAELRGPYRYETASRPDLALSDITPSGTAVPQYEKFELDFQVNRVFNNPYDPDEADAMLVVTDPVGVTHRHPAFFYEPWRLASQNGRERASPDGAPSWRARFSPWTVGRHEWRLVLRTGMEMAETQGSFECVTGTAPGFVRVSKQDARYFEFSGGDFFFPIGHNLRSPADDRARRQGTASVENSQWAKAVGTGAYAHWFQRMREQGANFGRIWMAPWWCGLEWNRDHEGFHGLGYYKQANAARLDRVLELAEEFDIYLNLETLHHGALSTRVDADWEHNPMNRHTSPEGYLSYASEFFENERARREHRNRLRYIVARWGYSRSIAWWGLLTETEWVEAYDRAIHGGEKMPNVPWIPHPYRSHAYRQSVVDWLVDTARYVRETDAHPRPVSAHFSMPHHGTELWHHDEMDVVHNNAYTAWIQWWREPGFAKTDGVAEVITAFADRYHAHARQKPLVIGEWGGTPHGSDGDHLAAELHTGMWVMAMTRCAGVAGFWWWNFMDAENLYPRYRALANFMANEDRREKNYQWQHASLSFPDAVAREDFSERHGAVLHTERELQAYIFSKAANRRNNALAPRDAADPRFPPSGEGTLAAPDTLAPGRYRLEYWDPQSGSVLSATMIELTKDERAIPLPCHRTDLALKLKPIPAAAQP